MSKKEKMDKELETQEENTQAEETQQAEQEEVTVEQKLTEEVNILKDQLLRQAAEYDNFKKRSVKEKSDAYKDATISAVTELLPIVDNFERALACECSDEEFKKGVEMIYQTTLQAFEKLGVKEIEAQGKEFDPNLHNAVNQVEDENFPENTVCNVFQKGYILGDKVVRHAMVVVANP